MTHFFVCGRKEEVLFNSFNVVRSIPKVHCGTTRKTHLQLGWCTMICKRTKSRRFFSRTLTLIVFIANAKYSVFNEGKLSFLIKFTERPKSLCSIEGWSCFCSDNFCARPGLTQMSIPLYTDFWTIVNVTNVATAQCRNYGNPLAHIVDKNFLKPTIY